MSKQFSDSLAIHPSKGEFKVFVTNPKAAELINHRLRTYDRSTDFVAEQSEAIFRFGGKDFAFVRRVLELHPNLEV